MRCTEIKKRREISSLPFHYFYIAALKRRIIGSMTNYDVMTRHINSYEVRCKKRRGNGWRILSRCSLSKNLILATLARSRLSSVLIRRIYDCHEWSGDCISHLISTMLRDGKKWRDMDRKSSTEGRYSANIFFSSENSSRRRRRSIWQNS